MRNKNKTKTSFPQPHCFFPDSTSLPTLLPPPPSITRDGEWGLWLVPGHVSTASSSSLFCSSVRSHPWDTVLHKPLQCGFYPEAEVLQEWSALVWVLPENLLLKGSSPGATAPARSPLLKAPASFRAPVPALLWDAPRAAGWISTPPWSFMGFKGKNLLHKSLLPRLQALLQLLELLLAFLPLASISAVVSPSCPSHPFPSTLRGATSVKDWLSLGYAVSALELPEVVSVQCGGSSQSLLPGAIPAAPCSKILPHKLNTNMHSAEYQSRLWPGL